jgi:hypothetical protein
MEMNCLKLVQLNILCSLNNRWRKMSNDSSDIECSGEEKMNQALSESKTL